MEVRRATTVAVVAMRGTRALLVSDPRGWILPAAAVRAGEPQAAAATRAPRAGAGITVPAERLVELGSVQPTEPDVRLTAYLLRSAPERPCEPSRGVVGHWTRWMERWPQVSDLAAADLGDVLRSPRPIATWRRAAA